MNVRFSDPQFEKLKSVTKTNEDVTSDMIGSNETNFSLTGRQIANICKTFSNHSPANI